MKTACPSTGGCMRARLSLLYGVLAFAVLVVPQTGSGAAANKRATPLPLRNWWGSGSALIAVNLLSIGLISALTRRGTAPAYLPPIQFCTIRVFTFTE